MNIAAVHTVGATALLVSGCSAHFEPLNLTQSIHHDAEWGDVVKKHTRRHRVYNWTENKADLRATLITPMLKGYLLSHRDDFGSDAALRVLEEMGLSSEAESADEIQENEDSVLVLCAVFVPNFRQRSFESRYSPWDLYLQRGQATVHSKWVHELRQTSALRDIFPSVDRFDRVFLARFPMRPEPNQHTLQKATQERTTDMQGATPSFLSPGEAALELHLKSSDTHAQVEWVFAP